MEGNRESMHKDDLRVLQIMEHIEQNSAITQRELAGKLNISVGMTNIFLKRIIRKGFFKIKTIPRNRLVYLFTPQGMIEKSRLTLEYLRYSLGLFANLKHHIREKLQQLEREGINKVVFDGVGEVSEISYLFLQETHITLVAVIDDETGGSFFQTPVVPVEGLDAVSYDAILIMSLDDIEQKVTRLKRLGIPEEKIIPL